MEAEAHNNTEAYLKSLNLPNLPSTLTLSKTTVPTTTGILSTPVSRISPDVLMSHKPSSNISTKYPMDISRSKNIMGNPSYPETSHSAHIPLTKPLVPTPTFPVDSGISINQVRLYILIINLIFTV